MTDSGTHDTAVKTKKYPKIAHDLEVSDDSQNGTAKKRTVDVALEEFVDFNSMLLSEAVLKGLLDCGFKRPSPIQLNAIPPARCGLDLIIQAKSGTGKTCVFVVTALETVILSNKQTQVIIIAPTREIACQIHQVLNAVGRHMPALKCACFIGGQHVKDDKPCAKEAQIVVGSPGRICQLVQEGDISVDGVRLLVFDEADKLMEDAHQESVNWVFSKLPVNKQLLVLSATYPSKLDEFLTKYMRNPQKIQLDSTDVQLVGIKQYMAITKVKPGEDWLAKRVEHLHLLLTKIAFEQCLIFCNFQDKVEPLCAKLKERDWSVDYIGAQLTQSRRLSAIRKLKNFRCRILISTDLTARGIDASKVNLVINFDIPYSSETYLHRIGRAGRFGGYGAAITLLCGWQAELNFYQMIEEQKLRVKILPDKFSTDLVSDEKFYQMLPDFKVPDLTSLEKKSLLKAAKKSVRAISRVTYKTLLRNITLERFEPAQYAITSKFRFTPFILNENFDRTTLKYERSEMLNVLKRLMNIKDDDAVKDAEIDVKTSTTESTDKIEKLDLAQEEKGAESDNTVLTKIAIKDSNLQQNTESNDENKLSHDKNYDASSVDSGLDVATTPVLYIGKLIAKESNMTINAASSSCTTENNLSSKSCDESHSGSLIARTGLEFIGKFVAASKVPRKGSGTALGEADTQHKESVKITATEMDIKAMQQKVAVEPAKEEKKQNIVRISSKDLYSLYSSAFEKSYEDYLCRIFGGFSWRKEVVACGLAKLPPETQPMPSHPPNIVRYDHDQMLNLYDQTSRSNEAPIENIVKSRLNEIGIFKDHSSERNQQESAAPNDHRELEEGEIIDDEEEVSINDDNCDCWKEYANLMAEYKFAVEKAQKMKKSSRIESNPWQKYAIQVEKYEQKIAHAGN